MPHSLFDEIDLGGLTAAAAAAGDAVGTVLTCLLGGGVFQHDPADPGWADRDRLVLGAPGLRRQVARAFAAAGHPDRPEAVRDGRAPAGWYEVSTDEALAVAYGMAAASAMDGGIYHVWCLLDAAAGEQGGTWEAALAAAEAKVAALIVVALGGTPALWRAAGWPVRDVAAEPVALLGAFDHALQAEAPTAILVA